MKKIKLRELFIIFLKIGGFAFGGGYAMLPLIEEELVIDKKLLSEEEFIDILAIIQGIPGVIALNSSLFIGYKLRGLLGALISVLGVILPSILIITAIANILLKVQGNFLVDSVFSGIRSAVAVLIFWAGYKMSKKAITNYTSIFYTLFMIVGIAVFKIHPIILIIITGAIGIITTSISSGVKSNDTN